jgi:transcriptional regulator with XRE-family HTH domain
MLLVEFLKKEKMTQCQFSKKLGVTRVAITHYCTGKRKPFTKTMEKIIKATNGEVTPNDFYNLKDTKNTTGIKKRTYVQDVQSSIRKTPLKRP